MNQIERIAGMESSLNACKEAADALEAALEGYAAILPRLGELEAYYASPQWMRDYEDDCDGKLPPELRRGVLSEDAVYHLLEKVQALRACMRSMSGTEER